MENSIQIFEHDINNSDNTATYYVSDAAITYFFEIRSVLDDIAGDLAALETESVAPFTPGCLQLQMELLNNINIVERILKSANKHDAKSSDRLIGVRDLLVKFDYIKKLMLHGNREFRQDAMGLFIRTGNLYQ